mgnify:CR=1 FL=1
MGRLLEGSEHVAGDGKREPVLAFNLYLRIKRVLDSLLGGRVNWGSAAGPKLGRK